MELTPWMQDQELLVEVFEQVLLASKPLLWSCSSPHRSKMIRG